MHYGDALKLSLFPAGRRLRQHIGEDNFSLFQDKAIEFFDVQNTVFDNHRDVHSCALNIRGYPVFEISESKLRVLIDELYSNFIQRNQVLTKTRVVAVTKERHGFLVGYYKDRIYHEQNFDVIVIGTGRSGFYDALHWMDSLGIEVSPSPISAGVRLECPAKFLLPLYNIHKDFKFSKFYGGTKVKSFCFSSAGPFGGRLKFCNYQDQFAEPMIFLDGHASSETPVMNKEGEPVGNFALLAQLEGFDAIDFINRIIRDRYIAQNSGHPIWQPLSQLLEVSEGYCADFPPSVNDARRGDVTALLGKEIIQPIVESIKDIVDFLSQELASNKVDIIRNINIIAPEVEFFWSKPSISQFFETNIRNCFVIGDVAGIAQGNIQASVSGHAAAYCISRR